MAHPKGNPLVAALVGGELDGYAALYDRLGPALLRFARRMLETPAEAEDAVQDVFVELVRNRHLLLRVQDLDAYIFAMLRHTVGRRLQRQRSEEKHLRHLAAIAVEKSEAVETEDLSDALDKLPTEQSEVIALKIDGGLTFAQIGEILNVSPNTAASRYRYALEKLRRILE